MKNSAAQYVLPVGAVLALSQMMALADMSDTSLNSTSLNGADLLAVASTVQRLDGGRTASSSATKVAIFVGGKAVNFQDSPLYQSRGKLLVPLRPICEALGAKVSYAAATQQAIIRRGELTVTAGGISVGGRTLLQLRQLCDALGATLTQKSGGVTSYFIAFPGREIDAEPTVPASALSASAEPSAAGPDVITAANLQHNLDQINFYRAQAQVPLLKLDTKLNAFALAGSVMLMKDHIPHHHFKSSDVWASGFVGGAAENQGDPHGWFPGETNKTIDDILKMMMDEGPGGGHHDNMLNASYKRVGVGLIKDDQGRLYLTNDFSQ